MSDIHNPLNPEYTQDGERRIRTKVACDYCRKRKSKCDGEEPCSKCISRKRECVYSFVPKERKKRVSSMGSDIRKSYKKEVKVTKSGKTIQELNTRINVLENLVTKLVSNLDPTDKMGILSQISRGQDSGTEQDSAINMSDDHSEDEDIEDASTEDSPYKEQNLTSDPKSMKQMLEPQSIKSMLNSKSCGQDKECVVKKAMKRISEYCGAHSLMNTLSARSLIWMKDRLQGSRSSLVNQQLYAPLKNVPFALTNAVDRSTHLLNRQRQVPHFDQYFEAKDKVLFSELLDAYYRKLCIVSFICPLEEIQGLFDKYYYAVLTNNHSMLSSISRSEYLMMNSALVLSLSKFASPKRIVGAHYPKLASLTTIEAEKLRAKFFDNAMHDYDYVSRNNEGYNSLLGLALLSLIIEESFISDFHINYIIVGTLGRYAKELGLHRVEVLQEKYRDTGLACRKLWLFCEYMSVELSYKSGKPMLINNEDVTTLSEVDPCIISVPRDLFVNQDYERNAPSVIESLKREGAVLYFAHFLLMLTRIKEKSYYKLYSKLPSNINTQGALTVINEINDDMKMLSQLIEPGILDPHRENPFVIPAFSCDEGVLKFYVLSFHLSFHAHLLSVNRVPFLEEFNIEDDRLLSYGNKSLQAARSMLQSVSNPNSLWKVDDASFPFLLFYPFVAFLSVLGNCLVYPAESSSYYDCLLLIDVSLNFFAYNGTQTTNLDNKRMFCDMVSRSFLRILIDTMEKKANVFFYRMRPGLLDHIESLRSKYPEIFQPIANLDLDPNSPDIVHSQQPASASSYTSSSGSYNTDVKPILSNYTGGYQSANKLNENQNNFGMAPVSEAIDLENLMNEDNFNQFVFGEINELSGFFNYDFNN
ncbi:HAL9 [Candida margitis]|uniref:HAL9 n=1 Tax=Candida margitis TaxID=1775924 RepID=UPI002226A1EE|nr:HAL9 [Candida margitis]KAI5967953.1 HAL9 [Candida margitis]